MYYTKPNLLYYRVAQAASRIVAAFLYRPQVVRNEIKDAKGPFVVIANHQTMLDFLTVINLTRRPMHFVISKAIFRTLPISGFVKKLGVIPKLQYQTTVAEMKMMKSVIKDGQPLLIYPTGQISEDGSSTPIPEATYKFLQWLKADVYVARCRGAYFAMPKWAKTIRPGKTTMDAYRLFSAEELAAADVATVQQKVDEALVYDAYRDQEQLQFRYPHNEDIRGLANILYACPHCKEEFTIEPNGKTALRCRACGYEVKSDKLGFLHNACGFGPDIRYPSHWGRMIRDDLAEQVKAGAVTTPVEEVTVKMLDDTTNKFTEVGCGTLTLERHRFLFQGQLKGETVEIPIPLDNIPSLPFTEMKYIDIQLGEDIFRCFFKRGEMVMKLIHLVRIYYRLNQDA